MTPEQEQLNLTNQQNLYPPREIITTEWPRHTLQLAARSLQLKTQLASRFDNRLFNIASSIRMTEDERKEIRKDQKNYIKMFTNDLYKKYPEELLLSQKQLRAIIRAGRMKQINQNEPTAKRPPRKTAIEKLSKPGKDDQKNEDDQKIDLHNKESSDEDIHEVDFEDVSDFGDDGDNDRDDNEDQDEGNYDGEL